MIPKAAGLASMSKLRPMALQDVKKEMAHDRYFLTNLADDSLACRKARRMHQRQAHD